MNRNAYLSILAVTSVFLCDFAHAQSSRSDYLMQMCNQKAASMVIALDYYVKSGGDRSEARSGLFKEWREKRLDTELQSIFIRDIDTYLQTFDSMLIKNGRQDLYIIGSVPFATKLRDQVYEDCIISLRR